METTHNSFQSIEVILEETEEYIRMREQLFKYKTLAKVSDTAADALSGILTLLIFIPFFALLNIGICIWLGNTLNNMSEAFFIISGFYLLVGVILSMVRRRIKPSITNLIIKQALK